MPKALDVYLWGTRIGSAYCREGHPVVQFEYSDEIRAMGVEVSPLVMPLGTTRFEFPDLPIRSFRGLPGLLSDSLPDKFGNKVIEAWLREQGRSPDELNAIDRLAYTGKRGMGALEYVPALLDEENLAESLDVAELAKLANDVLKERTEARAELTAGISHYAPILRVGSSAGGARAKALVGWNEKTGEVRSGQVKLPPAYDECYSCDPNGDWTSRHQMSVNGKRIGITDDDMIACAAHGNIGSRRARSFLADVRAAVAEWPRFAAEAEVKDEFAAAIGRRIGTVV